MHVPCMLVHCLKEPEVGLPRLELRGLFAEALLTLMARKLSHRALIVFIVVFPANLSTKR